jgi:hypothetical protein
MTARSVSIVLVFFAALAATGLFMAFALSFAPRVGLTLGPWLMPVSTFLMFVAVFFLARDLVLPPAYVKSTWMSLLVLSAWMAATILVWQGVMWALRPVMSAAGVSRGQLVVLLGCLLLSVKVLERIGAGKPRRLLP